jgi:flagellar protein FliS
MGATAYATLGVETGVVSATPHDLVLMLFDGASAAVAAALNHMKSGHLEEKGHSISKAIAIIESGLRASLDKEVGGEIAQSLDSLYGYMSGRLAMGNVRNQTAFLEEVHALLGELKEAWASIGEPSSHFIASAPQSVSEHLLGRSLS